MKLIQDLLSVKTAKAAVPVSEDTDRFEDAEDAMNWWMDSNQYHSFEGEKGVDRLEELINEYLDYDGLEEFLFDNSGCIDAILEWIKENHGEKLVREMQKTADNNFMQSLHDTSDDGDDDIPEDAEILVQTGPLTAWIDDDNKKEIFIDFKNTTMLFHIKERTFSLKNGQPVPANVIDDMRKTSEYRELLGKLRGMHEDFNSVKESKALHTGFKVKSAVGRGLKTIEELCSFFNVSEDEMKSVLNRLIELKFIRKEQENGKTVYLPIDG